LDELGALYREDWIRRNLYMSAGHWEPTLRRYIATLIARATGRPILQFNRVDFRLPWLKATFPGVTIIHLYRHPRNQWCSSLIDIHDYPASASRDAFEPHDHFYLGEWVKDLKYTFPFLEDERITHPYDQFYLIWKLSYIFGRGYADRSLSYEHLISSPATQLQSLFSLLNLRGYDLDYICAGINTPKSPGWEQYADATWFERREERCERMLREFFSTFGRG
jgi:hypothetical protein